MNTDELIAHFRRQISDAIDRHDEPDPKCSFASGMLLVLSALRAKDGPKLAMQIAALHAALRQEGEARGYKVGK